MNNTKNIARASVLLASACILLCMCTPRLRFMVVAAILVLAYNVTGVRYTAIMAVLLSIYQITAGLYPSWLVPYSIMIVLSNVVYVLVIHYIKDNSYIINVVLASTIKMLIMSIAYIIPVNPVLSVLILSFCTNELIFTLLGGYAGYRLTLILKQRKLDTIATL